MNHPQTAMMVHRLVVVSILFLCTHQPIHSQYFNREPYEGEAESVGCPSGWMYNIYGNHCYRVGGVNYFSWKDAQLHCSELGSHSGTKSGLVSVHNNKTRQAILGDLKKKGIYHNVVWTGLNSLNADGAWTWQSTQKKAEIARYNTPHYSNQAGRCGVLLKGELHLMVCATFAAVPMCELPDVDPCQDKNAGCDHFCYNDGFRKSICVCRPGYDLINGTLCKDINECKIENGGCVYACTNTPGSWKCTREYGAGKLLCDWGAAMGNALMSKYSNRTIVVSFFVTIIILSVGMYIVLAEQHKLKRTVGQHDFSGLHSKDDDSTSVGQCKQSDSSSVCESTKQDSEPKKKKTPTDNPQMKSGDSPKGLKSVTSKK